MANPTPWRSTVRPVNDGEAVRGSVTNRPTGDLSQQTRYLKEVLDQMLAGRALILHEQPIEAGMNVCSPVYLDDDNVWKPAIAELESDSYSVPVPLSDRAMAIGVLYQKTTNVLGSVMLYGSCQMGSEFLEAVDGDFTAGLQYISTGSAGKIVSAMPFISLPILTAKGPDAAGNYSIFVHPMPRSEITDHVHYRIPLQAKPAGLSNCVPWYDGPYFGEMEPGGVYPGVIHEVVTADDALPGWLPADHPLFAGLDKPDGAKFGYNISADSTLSRIWVGSLMTNSYVEVDGQSAGDRVVVNSYGIWWMDDTYNNAPWSPNYRPCAGSSSSLTAASSSSSSAPEVTLGPSIILWLTRVVFQTGDMQVSSLRAANSTILITDLDGEPAYTGHLKASVNFDPAVAADLTGYEVLKSFDASLLQFTSGPVVGGLKSLSPALTISGTPGTDGYNRGNLSLTLDDPNSSSDGEVQLIALNNVKEEVFEDVLYLGFPADIESKIRGKVQLNTFTLPDGSGLKMRLVMWFLARAAGAITGFSMSYRCIPAPDGCTPQELPIADTELAFEAFCSDSLTAGQYVEVESETFDVTPGDVVYFTLQRETGMSGDVGLLAVKYHTDVV